MAITEDTEIWDLTQESSFDPATDRVPMQGASSEDAKYALGEQVATPKSMTEAARDALSSPRTGLMIFNTTTSKLNFYDGSAWRVITST